MAAHLQSAPKKPDQASPDASQAALALAPKVTLAAPAGAVLPGPDATMAAIRQDLENDGLDVELDSRGVVVRLPQALLFRPGDDRINAEALATVSALGEVLNKIPNNVSLVGHADAVPIHNHRFGNNFELAAARSLRLLELLGSRYGIAESRLSIESYGSYDPKSTNDTPDGRAINRRVEIVIRDASPRSDP
jgi:chemotaxis protein MotB